MSDTQSTPSTRSSLFYSRCPAVPTNSSLAAQLGFLDEEFALEHDLDIRSEVIGLDPNPNPPYEDRLWLRHAGHVKAVWARSKGADTKLVTFSWLEGSYPIFVRRESGIKTVADLKGKRLAALKFKDTPFDLLRAQNLKVYDAALGTAGLTLDDVTLVDVPQEKHNKPEPDSKGTAPKKSVFASIARDLSLWLLNDKVDAVTARIPADIAEFFDLVEIYDTRNHPDANARVNPGVLRNVVVSGALLRERRDLVVRILARLLEASDWAREHPEKTLELLAKDLSTTPEALETYFEDLASGIQVDATTQQVEALRTQKDFLLKHGFLDNDFDIDEWVDLTPLQEARALLAARHEKEAGVLVS
ncbi:ABC transporter substrate-binding protein [Granulicella sibirica]|uniref:Dibenzothiophene desulfurization enzyme B n=1 Tax=Granulicella sibirica TaxID=2479048 RepID=A0A4Q0T8Q4_9BACT|nr:ABC transporter substrate-binding protein [Granulicella sibirica]RXH57991.1 Dibenzothiophene desulfurization enzyme B [Granulicella sibirica]